MRAVYKSRTANMDGGNGTVEDINPNAEVVSVIYEVRIMCVEGIIVNEGAINCFYAVVFSML